MKLIYVLLLITGLIACGEAPDEATDSAEILTSADSVTTYSDSLPDDVVQILTDTMVGNTKYQLIKTDTGLVMYWKNDSVDAMMPLTKNGVKWRPYPTLIGSSNEYLYIMTHWMGPKSQMIFLPLFNRYEIRYVMRDVEWSDNKNNIICYIDTLNPEQGELRIVMMNLLNGKTKDFIHPVSPGTPYPGHKDMSTSPMGLVVTEWSGKKVFHTYQDLQ